MSEPSRTPPDDPRIGRVDPEHADARSCLARYFEELAELFDEGFDSSRSPSSDPADLIPPRGAFLLARMGGRAVACGNVRLLSPDVGYIKRMWVERSVRGLGLGRRMLEALEGEAAELGCTTVRLETNRALQPAIALYRSAGYVEIDPFIEEPYAHHWFEKRLG